MTRLMTLMTVDSAAQHARVHPNTVRNWVKEGWVPERGRGKFRAVLVDPVDVDTCARERLGEKRRRVNAR